MIRDAVGRQLVCGQFVTFDGRAYVLTNMDVDADAFGLCIRRLRLATDVGGVTIGVEITRAGAVFTELRFRDAVDELAAAVGDSADVDSLAWEEVDDDDSIRP